MKAFAFFFCALSLSAVAMAMDDPIGAPDPVSSSVIHSTGSSSDVQSSTTPLGSSYYRHLAYDFDIPIKELVKFERKGFGRTEIVELILIANNHEKPIKELGNRRIKDKVPMETLAKEADMNYQELAKVARDIKLDIESRGDNNLPPPVFEVASSTPTAKEEKAAKKKKDEKKP